MFIPRSRTVSRSVAAPVLLAFALIARPALAQAPPAAADSIPLTLRSVLAAVERANPRARAAAKLADAAEARVPGSRRPPDPELQFGFMNYSLWRFAPDEALGMRQLQLMQMLPLPGKLADAGSAARARADAAQARSLDVRWVVRSQATASFYDAWLAVERTAIARETRLLLENAATIATSMYRVGEGPQTDVLRARVAIAGMEEEIIRMQAMEQAARARLAAAADMPVDSLGGAPVPPAFPDSVPALSVLERLAIEGRPMLAAGEAEVRAASADARLARRELWPDLQLGVQYGERGMAMGTDRMGSLMIGASLPVFARSRQLRMREESAAMEGMAAADVSAMRAETRASVLEAHAELASARRLATLYRMTVLPQAEAAAESALASYRTGTVDFLTVLDNRMTVNRYREELAALVAAEGRAWAELEMLTGRTLTNDSATALPPGGTR